MNEEPTTNAGRALLAALDNLPVHSARNWTALGMGDNLFFYVAAINVLTTPEAIAAIEAEAYNNGVIDQKLATMDAIAADRARLAAEVRAIPGEFTDPDGHLDYEPDWVDRAAVLNIIRGETR